MKNSNFPMRNPGNYSEHPIAIVSRGLIHIIYPNGEVEATTAEQINRLQTKTSLNKCLIWGYVDIF
jgi:hypothetical protein